MLAGSFAGAAEAKEACARNDDSQTMMTICADQDYQAADARLNQTYQKLVKDSDTSTLALLKTAQRAWVSFRDAECAYAAAGSEGGSIYPMLVSMCLTDVTKERIKQLEADNSCEEGAAGCNEAK
ncbi:MAG: DUF1311 domain-containing protein [Mesorhizobium sp.]|nr:DUF1311 domain-containing protein [Mesorhizobium sp.]